jgi:hypothetical protein
MQRVSHGERMQIASMLRPPGPPVQAGVAVFLCPEGDPSAEVYDRAVGPALRANKLNRVDVVRVFDSDFVVRSHGGRPALHEVFPEHGIDIQMDVRVLPGGGLSIRGQTVRVHGVRVPVMPLDVEFVSRVEGGHLQIDGHLRRAGGDRAELGCIHYRVSAPRRTPEPARSSPRWYPSARCTSA